MSRWQQTGWLNGKPVFRPDPVGRALRDMSSAPPVEVRDWDLRQRRAAQTCRAIRDGQEVYCPTCGIRWALNEDRPECPR